MKGCNKSEEFAKINPMQQIPAMQEINLETGETFNLAQSTAILRYLASTRDVSDHWYPKEPRARAQVDMYLDQHHSFLRPGVSMSMLAMTMPRITKKALDMELFEKNKGILHRALQDLERRLSNQDFICSKTQISIADLTAACELDQV